MLMGCIVLGGLALGFMKLWPVYNDKFKIDAAMEKLSGTPDVARMSKKSMAKMLQKQFDVNGIEPVNPHDLYKYFVVAKIKGSSDKRVTLAFEIRKPISEELDVVMKYNKTIEVSKSGEAG